MCFATAQIEIPNNNIPPHKTVAELVEGERKADGDGLRSTEAASLSRSRHQDRRLRRTRRPPARPTPRRDGHARRPRSQLAALLRSRDALGQRALPRLPVERTHRIARAFASRRSGRDERNLAAQVRRAGRAGRHHHLRPRAVCPRISASLTSAGRLHSGIGDCRQTRLGESRERRHDGRAARRNRVPVRRRPR